MKADKEMFINVSAGSTRIALTEGGKLVELHIERPDHQRSVGNIYKGQVQNVIPGMQAAFIDIGQKINAFLPFSEIGNLDNLDNLSFNGSSLFTDHCLTICLVNVLFPKGLGCPLRGSNSHTPFSQLRNSNSNRTSFTQSPFIIIS